MRDFLRRAGRDDGATAAAALGAKVDDIVSTLNDVEIVFDDDDRVTRIDKLVQDLDQAVDIRDVQAGGRLIEDIDSLPGVAAGQFIGQLDALRFAAGQRRGGLAQLDITEADFLQSLQFAGNFGMLAKKTQASSTVISNTSEIFLSLYLTSSVSRL